MELLKVYKEELSRYEADQRELANAEKLFDLPITQYPELLQAQKEMKAMEQIYAIYDEQKVFLSYQTTKPTCYHPQLMSLICQGKKVKRWVACFLGKRGYIYIREARAPGSYS